METFPSVYYWNTNNATGVDEYNQVLGNLLYGLRNTASGGDARKKYATGNARGPNFQDIYGLMQCTPDIDGLKCDECLAGAIADLKTCCDDKIGARVIRPSCTIRYEAYRFYEVTAAEAPPPSPPTSPSTNNTSSSGGTRNSTITSLFFV